MKKSRGKYSSIQHGDFTAPPISSNLWAGLPGDSSIGGSSLGNGGRLSYHTIPSSSPGPSPSTTMKRPHSGYSTLSGANSSVGSSLGGSIRNSAHSTSNALCLRQLRWCVGCFETKLISIEPVLFVIMFAVYLHKIIFELYTFNAFARHSTGRDTHLSGSMEGECYNTTALKNVSYAPGRQWYRVNGLLWNSNSSTGDIVEAETGLLFLMANIALGVTSIFGTLMLGPLSNRFGRKPALVTILAGMALQVILTSLIVELELDVHFFVLGSALRGFTGGVAGVYTLSYSYISELNNDKKWLVLRIGVIETLSFVAVALGLLAGGISIDELHCHFEIPAYVVVGFTVCAFFFTLIATSESHDHVFASVANRTPVPRRDSKVHTSPRTLKEGVGLFFNRKSPLLKLWLGVGIMVITVFNSSGMSAVITLYLLHQPLVWNPLYIGGFLGMTEFLRGLILVAGLPVLLSMGVHDGTIVGLSILLTTAMNLTLGFAESTWQIFLVGVLQSAEVLIVPTLKAMLSKAIPPEDRGSLFTLISVAQIASTMVGSSVYIPIYILSLQCGWPSRHPSGAIFLLMALVYMVTLPLLCVLSVSNWREKKRNKNTTAGSPSSPSSTLDPSSKSSVRGVKGLLGEEGSASWGPSGGKRKGKGLLKQFDISIGQDVIDRENMSFSWSKPEERRDLLENSYSSLSDYHSNRQ